MAVMGNLSQEHLSRELSRAEDVLRRLTEQHTAYPVLRTAERLVHDLRDRLAERETIATVTLAQTTEEGRVTLSSAPGRLGSSPVAA